MKRIILILILTAFTASIYGQGKQINQLDIEATSVTTGDYIVLDKQVSPGVYDTQKFDASKLSSDSIFNNLKVNDTLFIGTDTVTTIGGVSAGGGQNSVQINRGGEFYGSDSLKFDGNNFFINNKTVVKSTGSLGLESAFQVKNSDDDLLLNVNDDGVTNVTGLLTAENSLNMVSAKPTLTISGDLSSTASTFKLEYMPATFSLRMFRLSSGAQLHISSGGICIGQSVLTTTGGSSLSVTQVSGDLGFELFDYSRIKSLSIFTRQTATNGYTSNDVYYRLERSSTMRFGYVQSANWKDAITFDLSGNVGIYGIIDRNNLKKNSRSITLADDETYAFTPATSGWGYVQFGDNEGWIQFNFKADGTIENVNSRDVVITDTDAQYCVYNNGGIVTIKNRIGTTKSCKFTINY